MGVEDAVLAADFIQCKNIIGMHYDTFGYIQIDHEQTLKKFADANCELKLPTIGESFTL